MQLKLVHARLARGDYQVPATMSYPVWVYPFKIMVPWYWTYNTIERKIGISWDPKKTAVTRATARCEAHGDSTLGSVSIRMAMNDEIIYDQFWQTWESCQKRDTNVDVTGILLNGTNKFNASLDKGIRPFDAYGSIGLTVVVEYTGEAPKPPAPWWEPYLKYGLIAVAVVGAVFIGIELVKRRSYYGQDPNPSRGSSRR